MSRLSWSWGRTAVTLSAMTLGAAAGCSTAIDLCDPAGWFPDHMPPADECPDFYKDAGADGDAATGNMCVPGMQVACACPGGIPGGIQGAQVCNSDGQSFGSCEGCPGGASDGGGDAASDGPIEPSCEGECIPTAPNGWDTPSNVWFGPAGAAPPCPDTAPYIAYTAHAELDAPLACDTCTCGSPTGSCSLPETFTASSAGCSETDPSTTHTSWNAPSAWDGSCTSSDPIAGGAVCGSMPCVESLTIAPLVVNETGCLPGPSAPSPPPASWTASVLSCRGVPGGTCADLGFCAPTVPAGSGFRSCIYGHGDNTCPAAENSPYVEKHLVFEGYQDTRSCSACTCDAPAGSICTAPILIYATTKCSAIAPYTTTVSSSKTACLDLLSGAALGSKSAGPTTYAPGGCQPTGGEPMGAAVGVIPGTFCCIPSP